jgi:hypothetical protein
MSNWQRYRRTAVAEMRPYEPGDAGKLGVSVSAPDLPTVLAIDKGGRPPSGFVARNPANHADQWYVAQAYAEANFDLAHPLGEPDA